MNRKTNKKKRHKKQGYSCMEPRAYRFEKPWETIRRYKRNIIHAYQRVRYGYCDRDVWSIDWWFLNVMPDMLQSLRETTHGYPSGLGEEGCESLDGQPMALTEDKTERGSYRMHFMSELPEYKDISDKYMAEEREIAKYRDHCKNEGLDMFKKWFWNLWD